MDPGTVLVMRHAGSDVDALTAKLGVAARLTVDEGRTNFRAWKARPLVPGPRIIDESGLRAGSEASHA